MSEETGAVTGNRQVLTVRQLNEGISAALQVAYPRTVWVRGEVQRLPFDAANRQHVYFELHETGRSGAAEYAVAVALMGWDRQKFGLGRFLDGTDRDLQLANQLEVCLECRVDFYPKFGKLTLKIVGVDPTFSLGRLEARRRQTLAYLRDNDLLEKNRRVPWPELPLRIGLITAPGSAAEQDFKTGLEASPWAFAVVTRGARMQGEQLEAEVTAALRHLQAERVDVIVITRGGGSRADLSWFDQQDLAVAIAECRVPVLTAIGHDIDRSIADEVAHQSCKTPTAAAEFLVGCVDEAAVRVQRAAQGVARLAQELLDEAHARLADTGRLERVVHAALRDGRTQVRQDAARLQGAVAGRLSAGQALLADRRARLASAAVTAVARRRDRLATVPGRLAGGVAARLQLARHDQAAQSARLEREAGRLLADRERRLLALATQARLLDPARLLARGYTMTTAADGRILTSAAAAPAGTTLLTRFSDGVVTSRVTATGDNPPPDPAPGGPTGKGAHGGGKKTKPEANPGQEPLFR